MPKKRQKLNSKQQELASSWEKILRENSKPLLDKKKYGGVAPPKSKIPRAADTLAKFRDRIPGKTAMVLRPGSVGRTLPEEIEPQMSPEEYERRERVAREVKHCVMPLHKGNYILVTEEEMIKQMGKKTA